MCGVSSQGSRLSRIRQVKNLQTLVIRGHVAAVADHMNPIGDPAIGQSAHDGRGCGISNIHDSYSIRWRDAREVGKISPDGDIHNVLMMQSPDGSGIAQVADVVNPHARTSRCHIRQGPGNSDSCDHAVGTIASHAHRAGWVADINRPHLVVSVRDEGVSPPHLYVECCSSCAAVPDRDRSVRLPHINYLQPSLAIRQVRIIPRHSHSKRSTCGVVTSNTHRSRWTRHINHLKAGKVVCHIGQVVHHRDVLSQTTGGVVANPDRRKWIPNVENAQTTAAHGQVSMITSGMDFQSHCGSGPWPLQERR